MTHCRDRTPLLLFFWMLTIVNSHSIQAQSGAAASLSGTVTDVSGAVVSGTRVIADFLSTRAQRVTETDAEGR